MIKLWLPYSTTKEFCSGEGDGVTWGHIKNIEMMTMIKNKIRKIRKEGGTHGQSN